MYTAELHVSTPTDLAKIFEAEEKEIGERAKYRIIKNKDQYTFHIEAKDATALRIVINSIAKILTVHEKTLQVITKGTTK